MALIEINPKKQGGVFQQIIVGGKDLTEYVLGGTVRRSIGQPAGEFQLKLRPLVDEYGSVMDIPILVNDYTEIRVDREYVANGPSAGIKLLMRGLVDGIKLNEAADQGVGGAISRSVTIGGSDLGKIFQRKQIQMPPDNVVEEFQVAFVAYVTKFLGGGGQDGDVSKMIDFDMPLSTWIDFFLTQVYSDDNVALGSRAKNSNGKIAIASEFNFPKNSEGNERLRVMSTPILNNFQGSLWDFISFYCSPPFLEIFLNDNEDRSVLTARWVPWLDRVNNTPLQESYRLDPYNIENPWFDESLVDTIWMPNYNMITEQELTRNDFDRYTYFITKPYQSWFSVGGGNMKETDIYVDIEPSPSPYRNPYFDVEGMSQFGYKPFIAKMPFYGWSTDQGMDLQILARDCNKWLVDVMTFSDILYTGSITIIGTPEIKLGQWIIIGAEDDPRRLYGYVQGYEHSWVVSPVPQFLTRLSLTRISEAVRSKMGTKEWADRMYPDAPANIKVSNVGNFFLTGLDPTQMRTPKP